jgi:hypothetical protein
MVPLHWCLTAIQCPWVWHRPTESGGGLVILLVGTKNIPVKKIRVTSG